jgi:hypothetical protein
MIQSGARPKTADSKKAKKNPPAENARSRDAGQAPSV